jgi:deoxyribose-phosphate aldolase
MEEEEFILRLKKKMRDFAGYIMDGIINTDEEQYEWTVLASAKGAKVDIVTFSRRFMARADELQKKLLKDELKLPIIFEEYLALLEDKVVDAEALEDIKADLLDILSNKLLDIMVDERYEMLKKAVDAYKAAIGESQDQVKALMERFELEDKDISRVEQIVMLYKTVEEEIRHLY